MKSDVADEAPTLTKLDGIESESFRAKVRLDAINHRIAFLTGQPLREKFHYIGIGIKSRKRFAIAVLPLSQPKSFGL
ncbi:MAG TPA: hypothetical protein VN933_07600 [Candidatus Eremiobacteraceae bacterium]|nr:hypothetical protein [Candidatus Eremiobacteraceae bacterium]